MRSTLFLPSAILATVLFFLPTYDASKAAQISGNPPPASNSHVTTINDSGPSPSTSAIRKDTKFAFFPSYTSDSLTTISFNLTERTTHCVSSKLNIQEEGAIRSTELISTTHFTTSWEDFTASCLHETGQVSASPQDDKEIFTRRLLAGEGVSYRF